MFYTLNNIQLSKKLRYDKRNESDQQMLIRISKKFAILFVVIFMFDSLLDLLSGLIDLIVESLHLVIQFFEYSFELLLEHILNANHQESEVIIVNVTILVLLYLSYRFCLVIPRFFVWIMRRTKAAWLRRKRREAACWRAQSLNRKIKAGTAYLIGVSCILFFVTL